MFGHTSNRELNDTFQFQSDPFQLFERMWAEMTPAYHHRIAGAPATIQRGADEWRIQVPIPGIDPQHVSINATGQLLSIRAEQQGGRDDGAVRYDQSITLPQFLDVERISATCRHGMLVLTVPVKESVKPRRISIEGVESTQKQLTTA